MLPVKASDDELLAALDGPIKSTTPPPIREASFGDAFSRLGEINQSGSIDDKVRWIHRSPSEGPPESNSDSASHAHSPTSRSESYADYRDLTSIHHAPVVIPSTTHRRTTGHYPELNRNLLRHQREESGFSDKAACPRCGAEFTRITALQGQLAQDKCGFNPLNGRYSQEDPAAWRKAEIAVVLLEKGADVNAPGGYYSRSPELRHCN